MGSGLGCGMAVTDNVVSCLGFFFYSVPFVVG